MQLERQLGDKTAVFYFLSYQLATNTREASNTKKVLTSIGKNCYSCNNNNKATETNYMTLTSDLIKENLRK